jgi:hypothetical protein
VNIIMTLEDLNERSFAELRTWLEAALNGRVDLPRLTPDETPDVTILAAEDILDKPTRRDLERACCELVRDFVRSGAGSLSYVRALLHLAVGLGQRKLAGELAAMAARFPELPTLEVRVRQAVLLTLIDLKELQPPEFWWAIFDQDGTAYAGPVLTGLLTQSWQTGLQLLPRFPDDPMLASVAAMILDQALEDQTPAQRATCVGELQRIAPRCPPSLRQTLRELLVEHQGATRPPHTHARLNKIIEQQHPKRAQDIGISLSSRVVPVAA